METTENYDRKEREREKYALNVQKVERFIEWKDSMCIVHSASTEIHPHTERLVSLVCVLGACRYRHD